MPHDLEKKGSTPRMGPPMATGRFWLGFHIALSGLLLNPWLVESALTPDGSLERTHFLLLAVVAVLCIVGGISSMREAWRSTAHPRRRLLLMLHGTLAAGYLLAFAAVNLYLGATLNLPSNGYVDAPKAELYGWGYRPHQEISIYDFDADEVYLERVNSHGWRDIEHDHETTRTRVLLLGDSMIYGEGVALENTVGRQLQARLGGDYDVMQMGYGAFGNDQEYLVLIHEGIAWKPDVVILMFTMGNDPINNMLTESYMGTAPKPKFDLVDGRLVQTHKPFDRRAPLVRRVTGRLPMVRWARALAARRQVNVAPHNYTLSTGIDTLNAAIISGTARESLADDYSGLAVFKSPWTAKMTQGWAVTEALITAMARACESSGARFILYPTGQPALDAAGEITWEGETFAMDYARPYALLRELAARENFSFLAEPEAFRLRYEAGELRFRTDFHYTRVGNAAVADLMAGAVTGPQKESGGTQPAS